MFHRYASENFCVLVLRHGPPCTEQRMVLPAKYYYSRSPSCCALAAFSLCSVASFALFAFSSVGVDIALSRHSPYYSTLIHSFFPFFPHLPYPAPYFAVSPPKPRKRKSPASFGPFFLSHSFLSSPLRAGISSVLLVLEFRIPCCRREHSHLPTSIHPFTLIWFLA